MKYYLFILLFTLQSLNSLGQQNNPFWVNYTGGKETRKIALDGDTAWVATLGGLARVVKNNTQTTFYNATNSGLNSNRLNNIVIDQNHTKWIATQNGIYSFNGTQWKHFLTGNVQHIATDMNNHIWYMGINPLNSTSGLVQFDGNTFLTINSIPGWAGTNFRKLNSDQSKNIWLLEDKNILMYNGTSWQVIDTTNSTIGSSFISDLTIAKNGQLWLSSHQSIFHFDNTSWSVYDTSNSPLILSALDEITPDDSGNVYICNGNQLLKTNGSTWVVYDTSNSVAAQHRFFCCAIDSSKNIWVGTVKNSIYESDSGQWKNYNTSATPIDYHSTNSVVVDMNGTAYIGTPLSYVLKSDTTWSTYNSFPPNCNDKNFTAIDKNNVFWGSLGFSAVGYTPISVSYDGSNWSYSPIMSGPCFNISVDPSNNKWFATYQGLVKFDGTNWTVYNTSNSPLLHDVVMRVLADKHGNIWVSSYGGFQKFDGFSWQNINLTALGFATTYAGLICEDQQGNIYVSSSNSGNIPPHKLAKYDGISWTVINQLPGDYIVAMKVDHYNNLWVSFSQTGVAKFDGTTWTMYTIFNSGLPDFNSYDMDIDLYNNIWLNTLQGGIAVFNERGLNYDIPVNQHFKVSGNVFYDVDSNGVKDPGEPYLNHQRILSMPGNTNYSTNSLGEYSLFLTQGNYSITPNPDPGWYITTDSLSYNVTVDSTSVSGYDFGISTAPVRNYQLNMYSGINRCGFIVPYWIDYKNIGSLLDSGYVELTMDTLSSFVNSFPYPDQISGSTYRWEFSSLVPYMDQSIRLEILISDDPGDSVNNTVTLNYYDASLPTIAASKNITEEIVCAYDPNDKNVIPPGVTSQHLTLISDTLNYIIRFQNVGNDTAFFVKVIDTLDANIDIQSIQIVSASHPYSLQIENGVLIFDFPTCNLPDSSVNYANSCGYIHFKARVNPQIISNTVVTNSASIFFNFNGSIVTNEVFNTMVDVILNVDETIPGNRMKIAPNPFTSQTKISFPNENKIAYTISVKNLTGQVLSSFKTKEDTFYISKDKLPAGLYILELISSEKRYQDKLIIID